MTDPLAELVESYRHLVDALLTHTALHEGTDDAVGDYLSCPARPDDHWGAVVLRQLQEAQRHEWAVANDLPAAARAFLGHDVLPPGDGSGA